MRIKRDLTVMTGMALLLLLGACGTTPPTNFYVMNSMSSEPVSGQYVGGTIIGVGPVDVAAYLDNPKIVIRTSSNELSYAEFDRWAEPMHDSVAAIIARNIGLLLKDTQAIVDPWLEVKTRYRLVVKINRFDSDANGVVTLQSHWALLDADKRTELVLSASDVSVQSPGTDYTSISKGMSQALEQLSKDIARQITDVAATPG